MSCNQFIPSTVRQRIRNAYVHVYETVGTAHNLQKEGCSFRPKKKPTYPSAKLARRTFASLELRLAPLYPRGRRPEVQPAPTISPASTDKCSSDRIGGT